MYIYRKKIIVLFLSARKFAISCGKDASWETNIRYIKEKLLLVDIQAKLVETNQITPSNTIEVCNNKEPECENSALNYEIDVNRNLIVCNEDTRRNIVLDYEDINKNVYLVEKLEFEDLNDVCNCFMECGLDCINR